MRRRVWALALALITLLSACGPGAVKEEPFIEEFLAMDTAMRLTVYGQGAGEAAGLARERVLELEALLSVTDEPSDICAAIRNGGGVHHADTAALLERALALCGETGGALDVSVYPVVRAWGFTTGAYRVPEEAELAALLERVDYTRISLEGTVLTLPEGMELDLGAVAKGWTGDRLMELLRREGITSAIVELGGNVQALGSKPDGSPWRVAVQAPDGSGYAGALEITDCAAVTSGGYQRYFEQDGETYCHIIDPAGGRPARSGLASVTVVAEEGAAADALSTALFVLGRERGEALWRERGGFECVFIGEDGSVAVTQGLEGRFSLYGAWEGRTLEIVRK